MYMQCLEYIVVFLLREATFYLFYFFIIATKDSIIIGFIFNKRSFYLLYILLHLKYSNYPFLLIEVVSFIVLCYFIKLTFSLLLNKL